MKPQTLLFDADDTLWENNIYFERAITAFISYLDHRVHTDEEVRERLNHCERATIATFGYGLGSFRKKPDRLLRAADRHAGRRRQARAHRVVCGCDRASAD